MKRIFQLAVLFAAGCGLLGCSKLATEHEKFLDNHEIIYPGKVANIGWLAGNLRAALIWNPSPDPSITRYVISWNGGLDSLIVPAVSHNPADQVKAIIPGLKEYVYTFKINSFDAKGNKSIPIEINNVKVYGPIYQATLLNRAIRQAVKSGNDVTIDLYNGDETSPSTSFTYTDIQNKERTVIATTAMNSVVLKDYKSMTKFKYQTSYLPGAGAIDTFKVEPQVAGVSEEITATYFKNAGAPIVRSDNGTGKWGLPKDWLYNTAVVNQNNNQAGGWSTDGNGYIHFESKDWSGPGVNNGKIYQTFTLPAGSYQVDFDRAGGGGSSMDANFVVASGTQLPDISNLNSALAKFHWDLGNTGSGNFALSFKLDQAGPVAIGWVVSTGSTTYLQIKQIRLRVLADGL